VWTVFDFDGSDQFPGSQSETDLRTDPDR
jgi:hypothetical protein